MATLTLDLDDDLLAVLGEQDQPVERAARELMVLELYRRRAISSGKAALLLGMPRGDFIAHASGLGIPYIDLTEEQWAAELRASEEILRSPLSLPIPAP